MNVFHKYKRFIARLILICMVMTLFIGGGEKVEPSYADSKSLTSTYINLMKGNSLSKIDTLASMSASDLRVLALFLSNFYIPYGTALDGESESDMTDTMIEYLRNLGFDKDAATQLIENVMKSSLNTSRKLYIELPQDGTYVFGLGGDAIDPGVIFECNNGNIKIRRVNSLSSSFSVDLLEPHQDSMSNNRFYDGWRYLNGKYYVPASQWLFTCAMSNDNVIYLNSGTISGYNSIWENAGIAARGFFSWCGDVFGTIIDGIVSIIDWAWSGLCSLFGAEDTSDDVDAQLAEQRAILNNNKLTYADDGELRGFISRWNNQMELGKTFNFCWYDSEANKMSEPVYRSDKRSKELYAATILKIDSSNGMAGNSFYTGKVFNIEDVANKSAGELAGLVTPGQFLYVDWVGNIFVDMEERRLVVIPACLNPRTFKKIGAETADLDGIDTVTYTNFISSYGFTILNSLRLKNIDQNGYGVLDVPASNDDNPFRIVQDFYIKYGSTKSMTWDTVFGWADSDGDAAKYFKSFVSDYGFSVGTNDKVEESYFTYGVQNVANSYAGTTAYETAKTISKPGNNFTEYLLYDTLQQATSSLTVASEISGTGGTIIKDSVLRDGYIGRYFTGQSERFRANSNIFDAVLTFGSADVTILQNILITYTYAYNNRAKMTYTYESDYVNMAFRDIFPNDVTDIVWEINDSGKDEEIKTFIYYLLHPTEGLSYVSTWAKNKISSFLVGWHEDIVGNTDSNSTTGMTSYLGLGGYVTVPDLSDMEWTAFMLDNYNNIIVYVIIVMILILFCYAIVGEMTWKRVFIGVAIFTFFALLPPFAINATVNAVNNTADEIYSAKFDYWALCQTESYLDTLSQAETASVEDTNGYINLVLQESARRAGGATEGFYSGVRVKWMTPKRTNETAALSNELTNSLSSEFSVLPSIITNAVNATTSTQSFLDNDNSVYLYRDFLDVYRYGYTMYHIYDTYNDSNKMSSLTYKLRDNHIPYSWTSVYPNLKNVRYPSTGELLLSYISGNNGTALVSDLTKPAYAVSSRAAIDMGFLYDTMAGITNAPYNTETRLATSLLLRATPTMSKIEEYKKAIVDDYNNGIDINTADITRYLYGIPLYEFHFNIGDIVKLKTEPSSSAFYNNNGNSNVKLGDVETIPAERLMSHYMYALYSESPYYYFNAHFRDILGNHPSTGYTFFSNDLSNSVGNIKSLFLSENQDYFFNMKENAGNGYGELRDYMNMHDLFYYVIPALQGGIDAVDTYDSIYGTELFEDCSLRFDSSGKIVYNGVSYNHIMEMRSVLSAMPKDDLYKFWHNYNISCLLNTYTAWLDTMEDCSYAKAETIKIAGKNFVVENPLDPTSYYKVEGGKMVDGRYMVFSRSEMKYYGLSELDLTEVERRIIKVQDEVYKSAIDLLNYYTLSDETLIHAYSLLQLFTFNEVFSQNNMVESYILYPQGYELKAFTFDAYMRLILAESSGEPLQTLSGGANESIYTRVIEKTSILFGVVLLTNDILAVYIVPLMRLVIIVLLFFLSVVMITASAINLNKENDTSLMGAIWTSLLKPLLMFAIISIGLAYIVSLFMSDGASGVTKSKVVVSLGDPTMTVFAMCVINALVVYLYWKILSSAFKDLIKYAKAVSTNISGAVSGAFGKVGKVLKGSVDRAAMGHAVAKGAEAGTASQRGESNSSSVPKSGGGLGGVLSTVGAASIGAMAGKKAAKAEETAESNAKADKYNMKASTKKTTMSGKEKDSVKEQSLAQKEAGKALSGVKEVKQQRNDLAESRKKKAEDKYNNSSIGKLAESKKNLAESKALFKKADTIGGKLATGKMVVSDKLSTMKYGIKSAPKRALQKIDKKTLNLGEKSGKLKQAFDTKDGLLRARENMAKDELASKRAVLEAKKREREKAEAERHAKSKKKWAESQANKQQEALERKQQMAQTSQAAQKKGKVVQFDAGRRKAHVPKEGSTSVSANTDAKV